MKTGMMVVLTVWLVSILPARAESDIASRVMTGLNGGVPPGQKAYNPMNMERGGEEHRIDRSPAGLPPLLIEDYEPGDTLAVFNQRARLTKPDGSWVLLTYHGRWQASKLYSSGRRVDLNRVTGDVLYDSRRPSPRSVVGKD